MTEKEQATFARKYNAVFVSGNSVEGLPAKEPLFEENGLYVYDRLVSDHKLDERFYNDMLPLLPEPYEIIKGKKMAWSDIAEYEIENSVFFVHISPDLEFKNIKPFDKEDNGFYYYGSIITNRPVSKQVYANRLKELEKEGE